jgi:hypothetical protein
MACCFVDLYLPRRYATQERDILMSCCILFTVVKNILKLLWRNMLFGQNTILNVMRLQEVLYSSLTNFWNLTILCINIQYILYLITEFLTKLKLYRNVCYATLNIFWCVRVAPLINVGSGSLNSIYWIPQNCS